MELSSRSCFWKLPKLFDVASLDYDTAHWRVKAKYEHPTKYGVAYKRKRDYTAVPPDAFVVTGAVYDKIVSWLPASVFKEETPEILYIELPAHAAGNGMFAPHIDNDRVCVVNFYADADGEVTTFFDYACGKMEELCSFSANINECWVLNPTIPHAVALSATKARKVFSVSFRTTSYDRVLKHFVPEGVAHV